MTQFQEMLFKILGGMVAISVLAVVLTALAVLWHLGFWYIAIWIGIIFSLWIYFVFFTA